MSRSTTPSSSATPNNLKTPQTTTSDIIIVGAGCFGLSTALHLKRRGVRRVLLLDSNDAFPSTDSASNDTSRAVRPDYADPFYSKLALETISAWKSDPIFRQHYHETGRIGAALPGDDFSEKCRQALSSEGVSVPIERLCEGDEDTATKKSLKRKFPALNGPVKGWDMYYNKHAGWAHPHNSLISGMTEYLRLGGVYIHGTNRGRVVSNILQPYEDSKSTKHEKIVGVKTMDATSHYAPKVVYATGAYTNSTLLPGLDTQIHPTGLAVAHWRLSNKTELEQWKNHPVVDLHNYGYFFPPDSTGLMKMGVGIVSFGHGEGQKKDHEGNLLSGIATALRNSSIVGTSDAGKIPIEAEQAVRWILRQIAPSIADKPFFDMKICWDGMAPDGSWIIDQHPKIEGLAVAAAGSGHGFKFLPVIGSWITDVLRLEGNVCDPVLSNSAIPSLSDMRYKWRWGRAANMGVADPKVAMQGRKMVELITALRKNDDETKRSSRFATAKL